MSYGRVMIGLRYRLALLACGTLGCGGRSSDGEPNGSATVVAKASEPAVVAPPDLPLPPGASRRLGGTRFRNSSPIQHVAVSADGRYVAGAGITIGVWSTTTGEQLFAPPPSEGEAGAIAFAADALVLGNGTQPIAVVSTVTWTEQGRLATCEGQWTQAIAASPDGGTLAVSCRELGNQRGTLRLQAIAGGAPVVVAGIEDPGAIAWSADGAWLAVESVATRTVALVDAKTRRLVKTLPALPPIAMAFAPNGAVLAYGDRSHDAIVVRIYDVAANRELAAHRIEIGVGAIAWSRDGKTIVLQRAPNQERGGAEATTRLATLDVATGRRRDLFRHLPGPHAIAAADRHRVWIAVDRAIQLWDLDGDAEVLGPPGHRGAITALAYRADGVLASAGSDEAIRIWDLATGTSRELRTPPIARVEVTVDDATQVPLGEIARLAWSKDGTQLYTADSCRESFKHFNVGVVRTWDPDRGTQVRARAAQRHGISDFALAPDEKFAIASGVEPLPADNDTPDRGSLRWLAPDGRTLRKWKTGLLHAFAISHDGKRIAVDADRHIRVLDASTGFELARYESVSAGSLAFSPDDKSLAAGTFNGVWVYRAGTRDPKPFFGLEVSVSSFAFAPDGRVIVGTTEGDVIIDRLVERLGSQANTNGAIVRRGAHRGWITAIAIAPAGTHFATGGEDGAILIWPL